MSGSIYTGTINATVDAVVAESRHSALPLQRSSGMFWKSSMIKLNDLYVVVIM